MSVPLFHVVSSPAFHDHKSFYCAWKQLLRLGVVESAVLLCSRLNYEHYRKEE